MRVYNMCIHTRRRAGRTTERKYFNGYVCIVSS